MSIKEHAYVYGGMGFLTIKPKLDRFTHSVMSALDRDCFAPKEQS